MRETIGIVRYEYLMQIRRWGLWISVILLAGLFYFFILSGLDHALHEPGSDLLSSPWALSANLLFPLNLFTPVAVGILVTDRFTRDRQLGVSELIHSSLPSSRPLLLGKYLGSVLAVLTPAVLLTLGVVAYVAAYVGEPLLLLTAPVVLVAVTLPSWLFVAAWSLAFPLVMRLRLYQVLFAGFWMWAVAVPRSRLPTINQTAISVQGEYVQQAFFLNDPGHALLPPATTGWAIFNLCLILGMTIAGLVATGLVLRKQERA